MPETPAPAPIVGIDTGGTFTDFTVGDRVAKVRSTPDDPSRAVLEGLDQLGLEGTLRIVHGTTVATNALLTRSGAKTAFVTTRGLEDLLEIGRDGTAVAVDRHVIPRTRHAQTQLSERQEIEVIRAVGGG